MCPYDHGTRDTTTDPETNNVSTSASIDNAPARMVVDTARKLADGNGVSADEVTVTAARCMDHRGVITLRATPTWRTEAKTLSGKQKVDGQGFDTDAQLQQLMTRQTEEVASTPAYSEKVTKLVEGGDPLEALRKGERKLDLVSNAGIAYRWERHIACGGSGKVNCSNCDGTTKKRCFACGGSGTQPVVRMGQNNISYTEYVRCSAGCLNGFFNCYECDPFGKVQCVGCLGEGIVTIVQHLVVQTNLTLSATPEDASPDAFKNFVRNTKVGELPDKANVSYVGRHPDGTRANFRYDFTVPYAEVDLNAGDIPRFTMKATGIRPELIDPPTFLDELTSETCARIRDAETDAAALTATQGSRLTRELLGACAQPGKTDVDRFVTERHNCVSHGVVKAVADRLDTAYDSLGAKRMKRAWSVMNPLLLTAGGALMLTDWAQLIFDQPGSQIDDFGATTMALGLVILLVLWLVAHGQVGRMGHKVVQRVIGGSAHRAPRQPRHLAVTAPLAIFTLVGALGATLYAGEHGIERPADYGLEGRLQFAQDRILDLSDPLRLKSVTRPNIVRSNRVADMQWRLARMGFYDGRIDGLDGPSTQAALDAFHDRFGYRFDYQPATSLKQARYRVARVYRDL
ncbi:hypothetical protein CKO28_03140 [Rhodovibrio sodomensis]|uniref:Peptidoglycan binding-like domain-containing protein n=1 Tax=Rhodovibrio sodomensis TaxID=1088 RepID=A0ABS1DAK4_9PROT|nr:peptidoglycan-binding domain-containing protein [Rhodovibrio sodomensis]MBK1667039.1 hypothetical protein [Rhodovibrio sodomensis]